MRERYSYSYFCCIHEIHSLLRILQLCKKFPFPLKDGESIAINVLTTGFFKQGCDVTVLAINTLKHYFNPSDIPVTMKQRADYHSVKVDTSVYPYNALQNLFSSRSYNIERFDSADFRSYLVKLLGEKEFDIILLESAYLTPYVADIRKHSKAKVVLRSHNLEYEIWEHLAVTEKNIIKRKYLTLLASRLKRFELHHLNSYDAIVPISPADEVKYRQLGCKIPLHTSVTGIEAKESTATVLSGNSISLFFIGSMDWMPNQQGLKWFMENVWKRISSVHQELYFHLAGRNFPPEFELLKKDRVIIEGEVADATGFISNKQILVVPLLSGSGLRIKIIEAMAYGKTVISTSLGAEGIEYINEKNILIADTAEDFIRAIEKCITHPSAINQIGSEAKKLIQEKYNPQQITKELLSFLNSLVHR